MVDFDLMDMIEALSDSSCPICHIITKEEEKSYFSLIYEQGAEVLTKMENSGGLCYYHTKGIISYVMDNPNLGGPLSLVDIEIDLSRKARDWINQYIRNGKWVKFDECPVCVISDKKYTTIMRKISLYLKEGTMDLVRFSESVCLRHMMEITRRIGTTASRNVLSVFLKRLERNEMDLQSYKNSQRYDEGLKFRDKDIWVTIMYLFSGNSY